MASQDPQPVWAEMSPQGPPPPPPSGSGKIWMGLGIGCGVILLLCCGAGGVFFYLAKDTVVIDPVKVREVSDSVAVLNLPGEFQPLRGMNVFGMLKMVAWQAGQNSTVGLMEFSPQAAQGQSEDQMLAQLEIQLESQSLGQQVQVTSSETLQVTIRGEERSFRFNRGTTQNNNQEVWQVKGGFQGNGGLAVLMLVVPVDDYEQEDLIEIIEGIK